jgi:hypothetical protein
MVEQSSQRLARKAVEKVVKPLAAKINSESYGPFEQQIAAKKNIKKAAAAAKAKKTIARLPKKTRIALGKEGSKTAKQGRKA